MSIDIASIEIIKRLKICCLKEESNGLPKNRVQENVLRSESERISKLT